MQMVFTSFITISKMKNIQKLQQIASKNTSDIVKDAQKRIANSAWQKHAQKIAIAVLISLKIQKITQKQLAKKVGVSAQYINKVVKGKQKLNLETIAKLETALDISLINIVIPTLKKERKTKVIQIKFNRTLSGYDNSFKIAK